MKKLVSIVVPSYNVAPYISNCLDSILLQTYRHIEIIIVNDGSTDDTGAIIDSYAARDSRIKVVTQRNSGLSAARNAGMKIARGEYFVLFDSDDLMFPQKVAQHVEWLQTHSDCSMVYSDLVHFYDRTTKVFTLTIPSLGQDQYGSLLRGNCINPNTVCIRRSVYEKIGGFDESLRSAEDWDYWLRIAYEHLRICFQPEKTTLYRMRKHSLSADHTTMCRTALTVLKKQYKRNFEATNKTIVDQEIKRWHAKLYMALLKETHTEKSIWMQYWANVLIYSAALLRAVKVWWRLKRLHSDEIKKMLQLYATR